MLNEGSEDAGVNERRGRFVISENYTKLKKKNKNFLAAAK